MKANLRTRDGRLTFQIEGELKEIFREIAVIQEVFDAETHCGCCHSPNIRFQHRRACKFDYYELACNEAGCRARFHYGQVQGTNALFPKRREDGNPLPNGRWERYDPAKDQAKKPAKNRDSTVPPVSLPRM